MLRFSVAFALVGSLALAGCERPSPLVQRPWTGRDDLNAVTIGGVTRVALQLPQGPGDLVLPTGSLHRGTLLLHGAVDRAGATLGIRVEDGSGTMIGACEFKATTWTDCRIGVSAAEAASSIRAHLEGESGGHGLLSSPLLEPVEGESPPPVFVILIDTLRADRLQTWNRDIPLGSAIQALAADSIAWDRAYSSSSWTRTAVATLITGLDAMSHGVLQRSDVLSTSTPTLAHELQSAGWVTKAWSANPNILPLWGFAAGYDEFHDMGAQDWVHDKTDAGDVFTAVEADIDADPTTPVLRYIHLMDPHAPYLPGADDVAAIDAMPGLMATFPGTSADTAALDLYRNYLGEVHDVDEKLGAFLDGLKKRGLYERSLIVVLGDHGEEFLDHGSLYHGKTLYEEMLRVPVLVKAPGNQRAGTRIEGETGLVDVTPTILAMLGVPALARADGRSLWAPDATGEMPTARPQYSRLRLDTFDLSAVVRDRRKLVVAPPAKEQFFNLTEDPAERKGETADNPEEATVLRQLLDRHAAARHSGWHVRACGTLATLPARAFLKSSVSPVPINTETDDSVLRSPNDDGTWEIRFRLAPHTVAREYFGRITQVATGDEDEIVLPGESVDAEIGVQGKVPLRYAFGNERRQRLGFRVPLPAEGGQATVRPTDSVDCWPPGPIPQSPPAPPRQPYYRVWYVQSPKQLMTEDVDPAMRERLRSLGYNW